MTSKRVVVFGVLALLVSAAATPSAVAADDATPQYCLPQWAEELLLGKSIQERFELVDILARPLAGACAVAPWFTEGDFNGDGESDVAVRGRDRKSGLYGILVAHPGEWTIHAIGFPEPGAGDESVSYKFCHIRAQRGDDGKDALVVTPFKGEADTWRWTGSRYELGVGGKR